MLIEIPELSVIALIGQSEGEKAEFIKKHFGLEEIIPLEHFEESLDNRLKAGKLAVIDLPSGEEKMYERVIKSAKRYHCMPIAIVFNLEELTAQEKNEKPVSTLIEATDLEEQDIQDIAEQFIQRLQQKGFMMVYGLNHKEDIEQAEVERTKLSNNKKDIHGPFDIIGDIHGCYDELCELLKKLGYVVDSGKFEAYSPEGRVLVLLGDLVDRGPKIPQVLKLVMSMVKGHKAYCVLGNHDGKLQRRLKGANVQIAHGLENSLQQLEQEPESFISEVKAFLDGLVSHYIFDEGRLVVAHAGLKEKLHGRESKVVRDLAMFGETTGEKDEFGLPVRLNWSEHYEGNAFVAYGHTPQAKEKVINNTINIDTGCVFGGKLTAFRYPEEEIVDVKAKEVYYEPTRPFL